jgi:hypothetical protein
MSSQTETKTFAVSGLPTILAKNAAGHIRVARGEPGQVGLRITKKSQAGFLGLSSGGEDALDRVQVTTDQQGDTIRVDVEHQGAIISMGKRVTVDLELTVPAECALELRQAAGEISIREVSGSVRATTNAGNLETRGVTFASSSRLEVNAGNADIAGALASGASLDVTVNTGKCRIELPASTAVNLDAAVDVGQIDISGFSGQVETRRQIVQQRASGPLNAGATGTLHVRVNVGEIVLRGV